MALTDLTLHKQLSDATTMGPAALLRAAARLVSKALEQLDMTEAPCPHCENGLFRNRDQSRVYEQLQETPAKLVNAAKRIDESMNGDKPRSSSRGFDGAAEAVILKGTSR